MRLESNLMTQPHYLIRNIESVILGQNWDNFSQNCLKKRQFRDNSHLSTRLYQAELDSKVDLKTTG